MLDEFSLIRAANKEAVLLPPGPDRSTVFPESCLDQGIYQVRIPESIISPSGTETGVSDTVVAPKKGLYLPVIRPRPFKHQPVS